MKNVFYDLFLSINLSKTIKFILLDSVLKETRTYPNIPEHVMKYIVKMTIWIFQTGVEKIILTINNQFNPNSIWGNGNGGGGGYLHHTTQI